MSNPIRTLVQEYAWIHLGLGLCGNALFLTGSVLFLPHFTEQPPDAANVAWSTVRAWLFISGAILMLVGALGDLLVKLYERPGRPFGRRAAAASGAGPGTGEPTRSSVSTHHSPLAASAASRQEREP